MTLLGMLVTAGLGGGRSDWYLLGSAAAEVLSGDGIIFGAGHSQCSKMLCGLPQPGSAQTCLPRAQEGPWVEQPPGKLKAKHMGSPSGVWKLLPIKAEGTRGLPVPLPFPEPLPALPPPLCPPPPPPPLGACVWEDLNRLFSALRSLIACSSARLVLAETPSGSEETLPVAGRGIKR